MWGIILGVILLTPWIIFQLTKVKVNPEKKWEVITTTIAIIGVLCITFLG